MSQEYEMVEAWAEKTMRTQVARGHYYIREAPWSWQGFNRRFYRWAKKHGGRLVEYLDTIRS